MHPLFFEANQKQWHSRVHKEEPFNVLTFISRWLPCNLTSIQDINRRLFLTIQIARYPSMVDIVNTRLLHFVLKLTATQNSRHA